VSSELRQSCVTLTWHCTTQPILIALQSHTMVSVTCFILFYYIDFGQHHEHKTAKGDAVSLLCLAKSGALSSLLLRLYTCLFK
jgi:hypothetical protein